MGAGNADELAVLIHPEATNREAAAEPPGCRVRGAEAFIATSRWLREAFGDVRFTVEVCVSEADLVVTHGTMEGKHTGPFVIYDTDARIKQVFPATGRAFTVNHAHFFRMKEGLIVEHWAVRDDRLLAEQLGWAPPSPVYGIRMMLATRRARRRK